MDAINASSELMNATLAMDTGKVAEILERVHADSTSILEYNDENSIACVISLAYYAYLGRLYVNKQFLRQEVWT